MLSAVFLALVTTGIDCVMYQADFAISYVGQQFIPFNAADLLVKQNNTDTLMHCVQLCLNDIRCRTVNIDGSFGQCFLYSSWIFQGSYLSSSSSISKIAYIVQKPILYTSYLQPCLPYYNSINRYLQCVNNTWICPDQYFFNGFVCEYWRSVGYPCQTDTWCNPTQYLQCSVLVGACLCNSSMSWNVSSCSFGECWSLRYTKRRSKLLFSSL